MPEASTRSRATLIFCRPLLGLAGIHPEPIRRQLTRSFRCAAVSGSGSYPLVLGQVLRADAPVYFMTDDDPSRGLNTDNWTGGGEFSAVVQPNQLEAVIARLADGRFGSTRVTSTTGSSGAFQATLALPLARTT